MASLDVLQESLVQLGVVQVRVAPTESVQKKLAGELGQFERPLQPLRRGHPAESLEVPDVIGAGLGVHDRHFTRFKVKAMVSSGCDAAVAILAGTPPGSG